MTRNGWHYPLWTYELAQTVEHLRQAGRITAKAIADGLNHRGITTPCGEPWNAANLRRPLARIAAVEAEAAAQKKHYEGNPLYGLF